MGCQKSAHVLLGDRLELAAEFAVQRPDRREWVADEFGELHVDYPLRQRIPQLHAALEADDDLLSRLRGTFGDRAFVRRQVPKVVGERADRRDDVERIAV